MKLRNFLQAAFQLSLFDFASAPIPALKQPPAPRPAPPLAAPPETPQKPKLRQLQATDRLIEYTLGRSARRSIGFVIEDEGLRVIAPKWVTLAAIEDAIQSKQSWIIRKLHERREQLANRHEKTFQWCDGALLPFLGRPLHLRVCSTEKNKPAFDDVTATLTISLPPEASAEQLEKRVLKWLQAEALALYSQRMQHYAEKLGVSYNSIALSGASTQWGSCTAQGRIRLNWRLIHLPLNLIDYVIAHELSHLREMNHSTRFWNTVKSVYPEYMSARKTLRDHSPGTMPLL